MSDDLFAMVAGDALKSGATFNVVCNCGGNAPIQPQSRVSYRASKKTPTGMVLDKIETRCTKCGTKITAIILAGDPGYVLTSREDVDLLCWPQGSSSRPVADLSEAEQARIIKRMKDRIRP